LIRQFDLSAIPVSVHEEAMRLAIAEARGNPAFPFGAVIPAGGGSSGDGHRRQQRRHQPDLPWRDRRDQRVRV
jgi:hypothetical protein